jgi:FixJ family two-component response regulator
MRPDQKVASSPSCIAVVDDDESVLASLPALLRQLGFIANAFSSAEEFLLSDWRRRSDCLILDVSLPGMSGPQLQQELALQLPALPIIFITAQVDERIRRRVLESGAIALLLKPFSEAALVEALGDALRAE